MAADTITFTDKEQGRDLPNIAEINKLTFTDVNEIKDGINGHAVNLDELGVDFISGIIEELSDREYKLIINAPYAGTINETTTISASGTCTATFSIGGTPLGGTANAVSTSEVSEVHASANTFSAGDNIELTISSNASCTFLSFTIKFTRTLA